MTEQIFVEPTTVIFIQSRATTHHPLIDEYAEMMQAGIQFDPAQGLRDEDGQIYIYDGLHRGEAAKQVGCSLLVAVKPGNKQEAEWLALTANQKHGLRRTREDNRRIVQLALRHPYGVQLSDREIARHCGIDHKTVGKVRREMEVSGEIPQMESRLISRGGQNYVQTVRNDREMQTGQSDITPGVALKTEPTLAPSETFPLHRPVSQPHGQFDCPRCGNERIVHLNGKAVCLNCATHWPTPADFLAEIGLPTAPQRDELQSRFAAILAQLDAARLTEVTAWLDDLEERMRAEG
jgi:hypothetical protein